MGCATATIKYLVIIFNTLCALSGIGTIVANSLALKTVQDDGRLVCIFMIVLGSIVLTVSLFGCCGALRESTILTWIYAGCLGIEIIVTCILLFGYMDKIDGATKANRDINGAWMMQLNGTTDYMDYFQSKLMCCGKESSLDYAQVNLTIPLSCYAPPAADSEPTEVAKLYERGCLATLTALLESVESMVVLSTWIALGIEIGAFILAMVLGFTFRNQERRARY